MIYWDDLVKHVWDLVLEVLREDMHEQAKAWRNKSFCTTNLDDIAAEIIGLADMIEEKIIDYDNYTSSGDAKEDEICGEM